MAPICRSVNFLFAVKATADLIGLPEGVQILADPGNGNGPTVRVVAWGGYPESDLLIRFLGSKVVSGSTWRIYLVIPLSLNWKQGARAARFIRRLSLARPTRVQGPWSLRQFALLYPVAAADLLGNPISAPHILAGDDPLDVPNADYRPSDTDAANDTEADPTVIFTTV